MKQEEDSEEYGSPVVLASAIADIIKSRTEAYLKKTKTAVSSKPIVMRAEYAHCPNLTIIDTPGFVLKVHYQGSKLMMNIKFKTFTNIFGLCTKINIGNCIGRPRRENQRTRLMKFYQW